MDYIYSAYAVVGNNNKEEWNTDFPIFKDKIR